MALSPYDALAFVFVYKKVSFSIVKQLFFFFRVSGQCREKITRTTKSSEPGPGSRRSRAGKPARCWKKNFRS